MDGVQILEEAKALWKEKYEPQLREFPVVKEYLSNEKKAELRESLAKVAFEHLGMVFCLGYMEGAACR